jgi:hypothetical protein
LQGFGLYESRKIPGFGRKYFEKVEKGWKMED